MATIEGFDAADKLSPEQEAFIETGAFQCGYCTSGFIIMATQLLDEHPEPTDNQIKHYLSGNLCRCAAYPEIIAAVKLAAQKRKAAAMRHRRELDFAARTLDYRARSACHSGRQT